MGEWDAPHIYPIDASIMPWIDLCNVACGGHAGNKNIMETTVALAIENKTKIGAHPGFEDRVNFGRKYIDLPPTKLYDSISKQLEAFLTICSSNNVEPYHIKAHGALYHACNENEKESETFIKVVSQYCPTLCLLVTAGGKLEKLATLEGLHSLSESFIDRRYNNELTLLPRKESNAIIENVSEAKKQYELLNSGKIKTVSNRIYTLSTDTACIHGDNPKCLEILKSIRNNENV